MEYNRCDSISSFPMGCKDNNTPVSQQHFSVRALPGQGDEAVAAVVVMRTFPRDGSVAQGHGTGRHGQRSTTLKRDCK